MASIARQRTLRQLLSLTKLIGSPTFSAPGQLAGLLQVPPLAAVARSKQGFARFHSTAASLQQLLDGVSATQLRDALADEAELRPFMTHKELVQFILTHKAAESEQDAEVRADALAKAGVVLRFNGLVYLRPEEVAEAVYKLLPADPSAAKQDLVAIEQELAVMDKQHKQIYSHAQRWARRWLFAGCLALTTQLVGFAYLTWWELSWDVIEPVAYFTSLSYSLIAYIYFLYTRGSYFEQRDFQEYFTQQLLEKRMAAAGFDLDKYHQLIRTRERLKKYQASTLAHSAAAAAAGGSGATGSTTGDKDS